MNGLLVKYHWKISHKKNKYLDENEIEINGSHNYIWNYDMPSGFFVNQGTLSQSDV